MQLFTINIRKFKMKNIYLNNPEPGNNYDGPSDEELKKIEDELEEYSD